MFSELRNYVLSRRSSQPPNAAALRREVLLPHEHHYLILPLKLCLQFLHFVTRGGGWIEKEIISQKNYRKNDLKRVNWRLSFPRMLRKGNA